MAKLRVVLIYFFFKIVNFNYKNLIRILVPVNQLLYHIIGNIGFFFFPQSV